jgi:nitroimidazol reductase NimA-like FMN-containing flavoprotein (pyridoxamine 5'-phosphate oxidase superfamily)
MKTGSDSGVTVLGEDECWRLLKTADVGRLAVVLTGEPEIFPVNFVVDGHTVVFRTAEGTKLFAVTASSRVAFESDGYDADTNEAWSVVVKGTAERLEHFSDIYAAEELPLFPWQSGQKQWFVRVGHTTVTGVRFLVARDRPAD